MFRLALIICAAHFLSCTNSRQRPIESNLSKDTSLHIITTGIPDLEAITQMNFLAKEYGFKYYPIGCVVTTLKMDSIHKVNDSAYRILEERFGKRWKRNFDLRRDTINRVRQAARSALNLQISNDEKYYYYLVMPDSLKNKYQIKVYSTDSLNGKWELIVHYRMTIAYRQRVKAYITKTFEKL
jgi:hypothetical protein